MSWDDELEEYKYLVPNTQEEEREYEKTITFSNFSVDELITSDYSACRKRACSILCYVL